MNCPYCANRIDAFTGLQELKKFEKHLSKCRKNPNNIVLRDGKRSTVSPIRCRNMTDALNIRHESGQ